jgi:hypothetical protein
MTLPSWLQEIVEELADLPREEGETTEPTRQLGVSRQEPAARSDRAAARWVSWLTPG